MKIENVKLAAELTQRSAELGLPWCALPPEQMWDMIVRKWVLVVDDRLEGTRAVIVVPLEIVANMPNLLRRLGDTARASKKKTK